GNFFAFKSRGVTGPIRSLLPISAGQVAIEQDANWNLSYRASLPSGEHREHREYLQAQIHHVRGPARDFVTGNSPIMDARDSIALEIAAERFGGTFFGNGATPGLIFKFMAGFQGFRTDEERKKFIDDFQNIYAKKNRFKALMLPNGLEVADGPAVDNDKAQFLETRKLQRSIIAGVLGVPPHIVGDLDRATFSNIEEQSLDLVRSAILPICRTFESAMERDLLTPADRAGGIVIRFNLDGLLRGDFKSRQEGLAIQRMNGVINADEWREKENENPRQDGGGEVYWDQGPSGQTGASSAEDGG
ncbi:MAG: phage portal protein, partial [Nitrospinaceae bacterium]|nr:phage portal protein [Nitrospinaceae bacterium]